MRQSASFARRKRPSGDPTAIPTAVWPKSTRNRASPSGMATPSCGCGVDDIVSIPPRVDGASPALTPATLDNHITPGASAPERFIQNPGEADTGFSDLGLDHRRRVRVIRPVDRDDAPDPERARGSHGQRRIHEVPRDFVTLVYPVGDRAFLPGRFFRGADGRGDDGALAAPFRNQPLHRVDVPDRVQAEGPVRRIIALAEERHLHRVAAGVAASRRVQGLMDVPDQVHDPLQGLVPSPQRLAFVAEYFELTGELRRSAAAAPAVPRII